MRHARIVIEEDACRPAQHQAVVSAIGQTHAGLEIELGVRVDLARWRDLDIRGQPARRSARRGRDARGLHRRFARRRNLLDHIFPAVVIHVSHHVVIPLVGAGRWDKRAVVSKSQVDGQLVRRLPRILKVEADGSAPPRHCFDNVAPCGAIGDVQKEGRKRTPRCRECPRIGSLGVGKAHAGHSVLVVPLHPVILAAELEGVFAKEFGVPGFVMPAITGAAQVVLLTAAPEIRRIERGQARGPDPGIAC